MIISREARPWLPATAALAAAAVGVAVYLNPVAPAAVLGLIATALLLLNPALAVPSLVLVAALNRFGYQWGDSHIRVEIIIVLLIAAALTNRIAVRTLPITALRSPLVLPLILYLGANLLSSLLFEQEKVRGLKLDAEIFAAVLTYIVLIVYLQRRRDLEAAMSALWIVTVGEAAFGIVADIAYVAHLSAYGVTMGDFGLPMVYGTQWEPNIFGSFLLGNFFLLLADYVRGRRSAFRGLGLLITVAGIALSMTRTVWLGLILGAILFVLLAVQVRRTDLNLLPILAAVPVLALCGLLLGSATPLAHRLLDIVNLQSSSAAGRLFMFQAAISDWKQHPVFGLGTGSYNFGAQPGQPHPWLPNLFLLTLHDTGMVGLAVLLLLLVVFYRETLRTIRLGGDLSFLAVGSITGFTMLLLAFQTTTGFWFAYPWIVVAFGMAAARLNREGT